MPSARSTISPARRSGFSLQTNFEASSQSQSDMDTPTCEERNNYDVYNPRNPKHNPCANVSIRREKSHTSSSDSQKQSNWVHDLPRKSIHKARSGILALKAGLNIRRPRDTTADPNDTNLKRREASTVSTQEDLSFGVALYRTQVPWPSSGDEPNVDLLMRTASFHPLVNIASAPEVLMSRRGSIEDAGQGRDVLFR